jgi:excisionase family DNA binding protein
MERASIENDTTEVYYNGHKLILLNHDQEAHVASVSSIDCASDGEGTGDIQEILMSKRTKLDGKVNVSVGSIAGYCMVSPATVRRWIRAGELRATHLPSGQFRVSEDDFKEFLKRNNMPISRELMVP